MRADSSMVEQQANQPVDGGPIPTSALQFDARWRKNSVVCPVIRTTADWMIRAHYLGKWPGVVVLSLGLWCFSELRGVCVFALPPRETAKRYGGITWELARLWVSDSVPKNVETYLISRSVRHIKLNRPEVAFLVSYADPSVGHSGTIYRAAGWGSDGRTDDDRKTPRFDYVDENTGRRYSRRGHIPDGALIGRVARVSKPRFILSLGKKS